MADTAETAETDVLFQQAQAVVYRHEGGLVDNPSDPGGLTNLGISLRNHPSMTAEQIRGLTQQSADRIYYQEYWKPWPWAQMPKSICIKAYDASVVMGGKSAIIALQRALRACGQKIPEDGEPGPITMTSIKAPLEIELLAALRSELAAHFRLVAETRPSEAVFLGGWLARAYE